jgi:hypothetical protein
MTPQHQASDQKQLSTTVVELQTMSELIQRHPAAAQLIMSALEDGLTLGPMQAMEGNYSFPS